jgi:vesicle coat complex subunit
MVLNGQVVPDLIQKDLSAINKFFNKTKTIFSIETVSQIPK